ncbi:hypothetical protein [Chitinolyticbacter meiyuanensis]|uniref:hypothetical protein n=1 Tax=Chitinolyticbacter meiyuanensis TaxID=682798 RepID=UPI0011E5B3B2|nr:hypothetical protein [Chitinolyticbacter meiyuanensis]
MAFYASEIAHGFYQRWSALPGKAAKRKALYHHARSLLIHDRIVCHALHGEALRNNVPLWEGEK